MPREMVDHGVQRALTEKGIATDWDQPLGSGHDDVLVFCARMADRAVAGGRSVAVKLSTHPEALDHERKVYDCLLPSRHLPQLYFFTRTASAACLVLDRAGEPVDGQMFALCRSDTGFALELFCAVLEGVTAIHDSNVVHRDLHWCNVLLFGRDPRTLRVIDFSHSVRTQSGVGRCVAYSHAHVAPEMRLHHGEQIAISPAADVFALGVMLHELLTERRHPFPVPPQIEDELVRREAGALRVVEHLYRTPPALTGITQIELKAVLAKALAFDPRARYPSARSLKSAIQSIRRPRS
jgi:serine/threonine protein kinase